MKNTSNRGFTLVELMAGIIIGTILAITLGTGLYYTFLSWNRNMGSVDLQRDATVAMHMLARTIRPASYSQISVPTTTELRIDTESFYLGGTSGDSLIYETGTDKTEIIKNKVDMLEFQHNIGWNSIIISMRLKHGDSSFFINQTAIYYRN